jgi:hypothetical protein
MYVGWRFLVKASAFSVRDAVLLWILFFLISFGLGYPILNRYDPGNVGGTSDAADYANMVRAPLSIMSYRPFVPALAKPFYWMAKGRIASWNPALFGMLVATSILTSSTALVVIAIGVRCGLTFVTSLVGAMLFLFNFAVPNWNLAGYVDSGEAFFLALVVWSLLSARWWLLLVWAIPGSLSKETFAPFALVFAIVWWFTERPWRIGNLAWVAGFAIFGGTAVALSFASPGSLFSGVAHYTVGMAAYSRVGFVNALFRCLKAREFWYIFIWLLPLGLLRVKRLDHRWIWATAATFLLALLFGAYNDALGNTARALFNISGPLLSLSAAIFLTERQSRSA